MQASLARVGCGLRVEFLLDALPKTHLEGMPGRKLTEAGKKLPILI
jgi:hypothetical protein